MLEQGVLAHMRLVIACVSTHEERFRKAMGAKQKAEAKKELAAKRRQLTQAERRIEEQAENIDRFICKVRKYLDLDKLTPAVLNDMLKAVYVHAPDKSSGHGEQQIDISYDLVGIPPRPCSMTCKTEKRHSRSYAVSRKHSYAVL